MTECFNIKFEFDHSRVDQTIELTIKNGGKGYVCSVEGNILSIANRDKKFNTIVNDALVNICDGSSIALLASIIHKKHYHTYVGADLFINYIKSKNYKYVFLGNTEEILNGLKKELSKINHEISNSSFIPLPFKKVDDFDYLSIAKDINLLNPDVIWISLGAPKQEEFMHNILPHLHRGVMFGFGAIFNFYSGIMSFRRAPIVFQKMNAEWIFRLFQEPEKQIIRIKKIITIIPKIVYWEIKKKRQRHDILS